jgi:hypothetical protein
VFESVASPWSATLVRVRPSQADLGEVKSHCSRDGVCLQCYLMAKAQPKTRDFDWKETVQTDYLRVSLICRITDYAPDPKSGSPAASSGVSTPWMNFA